MDKRTIAFFFVVSISFFVVNYFFTQQEQGRLKEWRQQQKVQQEMGAVNYPVYRARVPEGWEQKELVALSDTTLPIAEFTVEDVNIVVHNFPADALEERVPARLQVERWRRQFGGLQEVTILPYGHGGFVGLMMEGASDNVKVLAWAMQLSSDHFQALVLPGTAVEVNYYRQMRADYTIKAVGPIESIEKHRDKLQEFARSFELIQEIPSFI